MKLPSATQQRYDAIYAEMSPLVTAMILAAIAGTKAGIEFDERGNLKPLDADKLSEEQRAAVSMLSSANTDFASALQELMTATAQFIAATQALPVTLNESCAQVAAFQLDYEAAASEAQEKAEAWRSLDLMSSRTKVAVAERLQAGGLSATAAEKAASGDPEYTQLRDAIAAALSEKEAAEVERDVCFQKLQSARAILAAQVQMSVAKIGAPHIVIREEPKPQPQGEAAGATSQPGQG